MNLKLDLNKGKNLIIYGLLFLTAMNFQSRFFYLAFVTFFALIIMQKKIIVSQEAVFYLILSVFTVIYDYSGIGSIIISMAYFLLYIIGYNMVIVGSENKKLICDNSMKSIEKKAYYLLLVIAGGSFMHYMLNFLINFNLELGRNTNDIWTGSTMAATGQAALACLMLGVAVALIIAPKKKSHRAIGIISILCIFIYDFILACRTIPVMFIIIFMIGLIYINKSMKNSSKKTKHFIALCVCALIILVCIELNIGGIQDIILNSYLFRRIEFSAEIFSTKTSRMYAKMQFILNGYKYPFGGLNLFNKYGYAHGLLLDGYDEYGLIGFILLIMILFISIKRVYHLIKYKKYSTEFKLIILCMYAAFLLEFCIEPILAGMKWLFCCYCLVNGCVSGMNRYILTDSSAEENI